MNPETNTLPKQHTSSLQGGVVDFYGQPFHQLAKTAAIQIKWYMKSGIFGLAIALLLFAAPAVWAQQEEPQYFVGMTVSQLIGRFGPPLTVHASRGQEPWQDDVVFQYPMGNFYIHRDRVWQVSVNSTHGIRLGDPRAAVLLTLGDNARDFGSNVVYQLPPASWPMALRVNLNAAGIVTAIFVYRSDY